MISTKKIIASLIGGFAMLSLTLVVAPAPASALVADDCRNLGCAAGDEICVLDKDTNGWLCKDVKGAGLQYGIGTESKFTNIGLGKDDDLKGTIADIINIVLGFLGIVAVIIILAGGFKWMTAAGNEDKVAEARQMITGGIIGLVIVFAAWAIASFVVNNIYSATV
jgi:hypothetical protein